jgi:hypothetical protein
MVHFFSYASIKTALKKNGFTDIKTHTLRTHDAILTPFDASGGIPFRYTPLRHVCIQATKRSGNR